MAFKMKGFKAHDMFDPKTGEKFRAKKLADHKRMDKMGYTHDSPKKSPIKLKDACYYKAKKAHKVFPSAYASGMIAKCRKNK